MTRVVLFTDTLGDINGPSRFIRSLGAWAGRTGRELTVLTSTRMAVAAGANVINVPPVFARSMPGYAGLEIVAPPASRLLAHARRKRPSVVHISTPGPVGMVGRLFARRHGLPIVATYHTDFPAYVDHLFADAALTWATRASMKWFYRPFARVLTRSAEYARRVETLGIEPARTIRLHAGVDLDAFTPAWRDETLRQKLVDMAAPAPKAPGAPGGLPPRRAVVALYVGRASVEKNLPILAAAWPAARAAAVAAGVDARLVIVGDGPYRAALERALAGQGVAFLGFRHGRELSALYASCDFFVFPSATDTLGQVVLEAQASGLAAVVSDVGGPKETIEPNVTGLIAPSRSPRAWAEAITALATRHAWRAAMGEAAAARMATRPIHASFEAFWNVHEDVHHEAYSPCEPRAVASLVPLAPTARLLEPRLTPAVATTPAPRAEPAHA